MNTIVKRCADSLRVYSETQGVKLKATHAHELVAAFFGYKSKAALQADGLCSVEMLAQASIYVLTSTAFIEDRRRQLDDLPSEFPNTDDLHDALFQVLEGEMKVRAFASFSHLTETLAGEYLQLEGSALLPETFSAFERQDIFRRPLYEFDPRIEETPNGLVLAASNRYQGSDAVGFRQVAVTITIHLKRVAGHVGYVLANISVQPVGRA